MQNDIIINKTATIERCIYRINEEYNNDPENLKKLHKARLNNIKYSKSV